jgi:hypothetical protein
MWEGACRGSGVITATSSLVVGAGHYYGAVAVSKTSVVVTTLLIYDNPTAASGALVDAITISGTSLTSTTNYSMPRAFQNGLYIVVNNTAQVTATIWYAVR